MSPRRRCFSLSFPFHFASRGRRRVEPRPKGWTGGTLKGQAARQTAGGANGCRERRRRKKAWSSSLFFSLSSLPALVSSFFSIPLLPAPRCLPGLFSPKRPYLSLAQETSGRSAESGRGRVGVQGRGRPFGGGLALSPDDDRRRATSSRGSNASSGGLGGARGAGQVGRAAQGGLHLLLVAWIQRAWACGG